MNFIEYKMLFTFTHTLTRITPVHTCKEWKRETRSCPYTSAVRTTILFSVRSKCDDFYFVRFRWAEDASAQSWRNLQCLVEIQHMQTRSSLVSPCNIVIRFSVHRQHEVRLKGNMKNRMRDATIPRFCIGKHNCWQRTRMGKENEAKAKTHHLVVNNAKRRYQPYA